MTNTNEIPPWFFKIMYEQCGGFVDIFPDLEKIWSVCQKHFVVQLNSSPVMSRKYVVKQIKAAGGSVEE